MNKFLKTALLNSMLILVPPLILSCSGMKVKDLNDTIEKYNRALKWGGYSAVTPLMEESAKQTLLQKKMKEMQDKSIVEYALSDLSLDNSGKVATALVQYSCINQKTQSLNEFGEIQIWENIKGKWYLSKIISSEEKKQNNPDLFK